MPLLGFGALRAGPAARRKVETRTRTLSCFPIHRMNLLHQHKKHLQAPFPEAVTSCRDPRQYREGCAERGVSISPLPNTYCHTARSPSPEIRLPDASAPGTHCCF